MLLRRFQWFPWLVALLAAAWLLRAPFLDREIWNLDEGVTFTMAQQVREGAVLYRDAADSRSPLVPYLKAAVYVVAGDWNIHAAHVAAALAWGWCAFGLLAIASRLGDRATGRWAALAFTVAALVLPGPEDSLALHTEAFVVWFSTLGFWFFVRRWERGGFWAGVPIGAAFAASALCKQPGVLDFAVVAGLVALLAWCRPSGWRRLSRLLLGALTAFVVAFGLTCAYFALNGAWRDFVYYAWTFNTRLYVPEVPLLQRLALVRLSWDLALRGLPAALVLGLPGLAWLGWAAVRSLRRREASLALLPVLALGWTASGLVATMLSGRPFTHYAIQVIPGLSLACGWMLARSVEGLRAIGARGGWRAAPGALALVAIGGWAVVSTTAFRHRVVPTDDPADIRLRQLVRRYTSPRDRIFVWGYFPEAHVFTRRLPATRFLYSNYLTGLIPWTNLGPDVDTRYAVTPGAWNAFWSDYRATPPRLILDSDQRGYLKYQLLSQPGLRDEVIDHFVQVDVASAGNLPAACYVRIAAPDPALAGLQPPVDPAVQLDVSQDGRQPDLVFATVQAPAGSTEVTLRIDGRPRRRFTPPAAQPVDARFALRLSDLTSSTRMTVDVLVRSPAGLVASRTIDVPRRLMLDLRPFEPAPVLTYGSKRLTPLAGGNRADWHPQTRESMAGWRTAGPFTLTLPRPRHMQILDFDWQRASGGRGGASPDDPGIEVLLDTGNGGPQPVPVQTTAGAGGLPHVTAEFPGVEPGRVVLHCTAPGEIWLGGLRGEAHGPTLRFGARSIAPAAAFQNDYQRLTLAADGSWDTRAFARLIYGREPGMEGLVIEYGIRDSAYVPGREAGAPHVILEMNLIHDDGRAENLMSRGLEPATRPGDRGLQVSRMSLPDRSSGDIEVRMVPYLGANPNDCAYIRRIRAQGPGPDLVIGPDRVLVPVDSVGADGARLRARGAEGWIAHAPSRVTYACPADLRVVRIGYGLDDAARFDEHGRRRSDGITAVVTFVDAKGGVSELYRRTIDPAGVAADRGTQHARVELPGREGRLVVTLNPGPRNDASFDWSYLTDFTGECAPASPPGATASASRK